MIPRKKAFFIVTIAVMVFLSVSCQSTEEKAGSVLSQGTDLITDQTSDIMEETPTEKSSAALEEAGEGCQLIFENEFYLQEEKWRIQLKKEDWRANPMMMCLELYSQDDNVWRSYYEKELRGEVGQVSKTEEGYRITMADSSYIAALSYPQQDFFVDITGERVRLFQYPKVFNPYEFGGYWDSDFLQWTGDLWAPENLESQTSRIMPDSGSITGSALLIGLESNIGRRTLWITRDNYGEFCYLTLPEVIIQNINDQFYATTGFEYQYREYENVNDYSRFHNGLNLDYNMNYFFRYPVEEKPDIEGIIKAHNMEALIYDRRGYLEERETIDYLGPVYASYHSDHYWRGGGSGFYSLIIQGFRNMDTGLEEELYSLLEVPKEQLNQELSTYIELTEIEDQRKNEKSDQANYQLMGTDYYIDETMLEVRRRDGEVYFTFPWIVRYYSPNSSPIEAFQTWVYLKADVPKKISGEENLKPVFDFDRIRDRYEGARDILTSPDMDLMAVLTEDSLLLYNGCGEENLLFPVDTLPIAPDENIVWAQWADERKAVVWDQMLKELRLEAPYIEGEIQTSSVTGGDVG